MSVGNAILLVFGIAQCLFLPALVAVRLVYGFQLGLIHWALGGLFAAWGISNVIQALRRSRAPVAES